MFNEGRAAADFKISIKYHWKRAPPIDFDPFVAANDSAVETIRRLEAEKKPSPTRSSLVRKGYRSGPGRNKPI
jgi:hypothetical protein